MVPTKVDAAGVVDLLDIAVGDHDRERLDRACLRYRAGPTELAGGEDRLVVGVVGYQRHTDWPGLVWRVELLHIATRPDRQRRGIAAAMVGWVLAQHPGALIEAQTDRASVGFYRSIGFDVVSLGELYPSLERFRAARRA